MLADNSRYPEIYLQTMSNAEGFRDERSKDQSGLAGDRIIISEIGLEKPPGDVRISGFFEFHVSDRFGYRAHPVYTFGECETSLGRFGEGLRV